jgi:MFS family permease
VSAPDPSPASDPSRAELQRRTLRVLVASQVLGGVGVGAGIAVVGLLAYDLSGTESLSGVSATASVLGAAGAAFAIARISAARGRRPGLVTGYLLGAVGAVAAVVAAAVGSFPLHVVASLAFGWASAANLQARYAATDLAAPDASARALSTVVWATTVGAVLGPNLTGPGETVAAMFSLPPLAGPYLFSLVSFLTAAAVQLVGLRPDPLLVVGAAAGRPVGRTAPPPMSSALATIRGVPPALASLTAIAAAHATMVGVMVMTPVHLEHHGAALQVVGLTISLHIAGMYALSPLMGRAADRIGRVPVMLAGMAQLAVAVILAAVAPPVGSPWFQVALILLGTGWSACLVAGSTLLTDGVPLDERPTVQGASDLLMNLAGGVGGILAGIVLAVAGYRALAFGSLLLLVVPTWLLLRLRWGVPDVAAARGGAGTGPAGLVVQTPDPERAGTTDGGEGGGPVR